MTADASTVEAPPRHSKERIVAPWADIRDCVAAGIAMSKVAKQFAEYHPRGWEPLHELIRKRAQRDKWLVPATVIAAAKDRLTASGIVVPTQEDRPKLPSHVPNRVVPDPRDPVKTGNLLSQTLAEMGEEGSVIAGELSLGLLQAARENPDRIAPIVDVKDIAASVKTLRLVAGMDRQGPVVSLNLWADAQMSRAVAGTVQSVPEVETWSDEE